MNTYYFSGSLTQSMHDMLEAMPDFEPLDILITQLDRSAITKAIEWKKQGFIRTLFVDSGAFSVHTGNAKLPGWKKSELPTFRDWEDEYIRYINSIDEYVDVFAQLDTIPGEFQKPKKPEDYVESVKKSWDNYLYMRERVKSPNKLMPVFHHNESFDALRTMLEWRDENGEPLGYIGLSPANDITTSGRNIYINECNSVIAASSNPNVKTHLYGYTSLEGLSKLACYSADSISHRHISAYNKILSTHFGVISLTQKARTSSTKSNMSFVDTCDDYNKKLLMDEIEGAGFTLDQLREDSSARVAFTIHSIQKLIKTTYAFDANKLKKPKKLFDI